MSLNFSYCLSQFLLSDYILDRSANSKQDKFEKNHTQEHHHNQSAESQWYGENVESTRKIRMFYIQGNDDSNHGGYDIRNH